MVHAADAGLTGHPPDLARGFDALGDPVRLGVIARLRQGPVRSGDLADALGVSRPSMSKHLKILRDAGLVVPEPGDDARVRTYRVDPDAVRGLRDWLDEVQGFWEDRLAGFAEHLAELDDDR